MFRRPDIPAVDPVDVPAKLDDGALLVDVREQKEWDEARIPGAVLKPMSVVNDWYQDLPTDREVILYCRSGQRSAQIIEALVTQAGMTNVLNLTGGIIAWANSELPIET